jgi:hypothetical protein
MTEQTETAAKPAKETKAPVEGVSKDRDTPKPPGDLRRAGPKEKRKGPFVKYVGRASHRKITPAQWRTLNIELADDKAEHVWSVANGKMIESEKFSDAQLDYLLIDDRQTGSNAHAFLEVDFNDKGQLVQVVPE